MTEREISQLIFLLQQEARSLDKNGIDILFKFPGGLHVAKEVKAKLPALKRFVLRQGLPWVFVRIRVFKVLVKTPEPEYADTVRPDSLQGCGNCGKVTDMPGLCDACMTKAEESIGCTMCGAPGDEALCLACETGFEWHRGDYGPMSHQQRSGLERSLKNRREKYGYKE